jgi:hypothetical protein
VARTEPSRDFADHEQAPLEQEQIMHAFSPSILAAYALAPLAGIAQ